MIDEIDRARVEELPPKSGMITRTFATIFIIGAIAFWLFAFSPWARDMFNAPDQFEDETFVTELDQRCAVALQLIDDLPSAQTARSPEERADVVDQATAALQAMVGDLADFAPTAERDERLLRQWLADWDIYIRDRVEHSERMRTEGDVRFLNSEDNGVFVHERMDGFARVNNLDACATPGDI